MKLPPGVDVDWLMFTIYDRPRDFPTAVVVRAVTIRRQRNPRAPIALPETWIFADVESARRAIRATKGFAICFPRDEDDVASVVESWF